MDCVRKWKGGQSYKAYWYSVFGMIELGKSIPEWAWGPRQVLDIRISGSSQAKYPDHREYRVVKHLSCSCRYPCMARIKYILLPVLVLLIGQLAHAQQFLSHFSLASGQGKVVLNWTIAAGNTCLGIDIVRSTDGQSFSSIGSIGGVCGSIDEPVSYSFVDEAPALNQTNSYKLLLGLDQESEVRSVEVVDLGSTGYQIRPHPVYQDGVLYFENDREEPHTLSIFQLNGHLLSEQSSSTDHFILDLSAWPAGLYPFRITNTRSGEGKAKGKVVHQ